MKTTMFCFPLWLMVRSIIPAIVARRYLSWPNDISTRDVWRGMVLVALVSSEFAQVPLLSITMATSAYVLFQDSKSAMEWVFLGFLAWQSSYLTPYMEPLVSFSFLGPFAPIGSFLLSVLVVGEGWWKLVTLYAFTRAYLPLSVVEADSADAQVDAVEADVAAALAVEDERETNESEMR